MSIATNRLKRCRGGNCYEGQVSWVKHASEAALDEAALVVLGVFCAVGREPCCERSVIVSSRCQETDGAVFGELGGADDYERLN